MLVFRLISLSRSLYPLHFSLWIYFLNENVRRKVFWSPHSCSLIQVGGHSVHRGHTVNIIVSSQHLQALSLLFMIISKHYFTLRNIYSFCRLYNSLCRPTLTALLFEGTVTRYFQLQVFSANFLKNSQWPLCYFQGLGGRWFMKKNHKQKISRHCPFNGESSNACVMKVWSFLQVFHKKANLRPSTFLIHQK